MPSVSQVVKMRRRRSPWGWLASWRFGCLGVFGLLLSLGSIVAALAYTGLVRDLPSVEALPALLEPPGGLLLQPTRLYDRSGQVVILALENPAAPGRRYLHLRPVAESSDPGYRDSAPAAEESYFSENLVTATIGASDPAFWQHPGFSLAGIKQGTHPTLAQRLVSDLLLQDEEPSLRRALRERLLAAQVTQRYGREKVLEWYLNIASYGRLAYGADAAARLYLGKPATHLNLAEAALLAGVAQDPSLNPQDAPQAALERQKHVIQELLRYRMISPQAGIQAVQEELVLQQPDRPGQALALGDLKPQVAPAFAQLALAELATSMASRRVAFSQFERGGLRVITTLDIDLQQQAACTTLVQLARLRSQAGAPGDCQAARLLPELAGLSDLPGFNGAGLQAEVVVLDPLTGQVLALVSNRSAAATDAGGPVPTGPAVGDALPPGSAPLGEHPAGTLATPFIYLTGFTRGMSPASLVWDISPAQESFAAAMINQPAGITNPNYSSPAAPPDNGSSALPNLDGDYHGPMRLRTALANDYLQPAEQVLAQVGAENVWRITQQLGIRFPENSQHSSDSALTTFRPINLLEISQAYAIFANLGNQTGHVAPGEVINYHASSAPPPPAPLLPATLLCVEDIAVVTGQRNGESDTTHGQVYLDLSAAQSRPIISPQLAYLVTHVLSDEAARWQSLGHPNALEIGQPVAVKIGRTPHGESNWTVGYTPTQVVGVWLGSEAPEQGWSSQESRLLLEATMGLWHAIMQHNSHNLPYQAWNVPEGLSYLKVCDPSGLLPTEACPNVVEEVFLAGSEPIQSDTLYRLVAVDRESGRLATVFTPPDRVDNRPYFIAPDSASSWAKQTGYKPPPNVYDPIPLNLPGSPDAQITFPGMAGGRVEVVRGQVPITGTASGSEFASFRIQVGQGLNPHAWYLVGEDVTRPVMDGRLGTWDSGAANGLYAIQLVVVHQDQSVQRTTVLVTVDNQPPQVQIVSPIKDEEVDAQERNRLILQADILDDLGIARADFYLDGRLLASLAQAPYALAWTATPGAHTLRVVATDQAGNTGEALVNFTVTGLTTP